jgi:hypothetical protein
MLRLVKRRNMKHDPGGELMNHQIPGLGDHSLHTVHHPSKGLSITTQIETISVNKLSYAHPSGGAEVDAQFDGHVEGPADRRQRIQS